MALITQCWLLALLLNVAYCQFGGGWPFGNNNNDDDDDNGNGGGWPFFGGGNGGNGNNGMNNWLGGGKGNGMNDWLGGMNIPGMGNSNKNNDEDTDLPPDHPSRNPADTDNYDEQVDEEDDNNTGWNSWIPKINIPNIGTGSSTDDDDDDEDENDWLSGLGDQDWTELAKVPTTNGDDQGWHGHDSDAGTRSYKPRHPFSPGAQSQTSMEQCKAKLSPEQKYRLSNAEHRNCACCTKDSAHSDGLGYKCYC